MDKSRLLREFEARATAEAFDLDAVRLYLLLLAGSLPAGCGRLPVAEIRRAFGEEFSPQALRAACRTLVDKGLVELVPPSPLTESEPDADLLYRLRSPAERKKPKHFCDA